MTTLEKAYPFALSFTRVFHAGTFKGMEIPRDTSRFVTEGEAVKWAETLSTKRPGVDYTVKDWSVTESK